MTNIRTGRTETKIECNKIALPEFADLLFGTAIDGSSYFDATLFLKNTNTKDKNIDGFKSEFQFCIGNIQKAYNIKNPFMLNHDGHTLVTDKLCFLFISYCDPNFMVWVNERIHELLFTGYSVSDSMLVKLVTERIGIDELTKFYDNDNSI